MKRVLQMHAHAAGRWRMSWWTRVCLVSTMAFAFGGASWTSLAQVTKTARDGVYAVAQATRGRAVYDEHCRSCHGEALGGSLAPPLTGVPFLTAWDALTMSDLVEKIRNTMPATNPGSLSPTQATDVAAFLLQSNGFPAGPSALPADDALKHISIVAPAKPAAAASPANTPAALLTGLPTGNMAQVMRGILFPSSNLIFNVQNQDPSAQKVGWEPGASAFSWVDWGAGIYSGWELIDYAAVSLAESAPLLLTPGRRCENGKPVPVQNAEWIKFTQGLVDAGRAAYRASQSRNRDAVIGVTNQVADACLNCHEVYRDKPGGSTADPSNKAGRCAN